MKNTGTRKPSAGSRIIVSLREVEWVEGKDVPVRVTTADVISINVRATRKRLGLSQAAFAAKYGFQLATLRNWEQGRTDGPAACVACRDRPASGSYGRRSPKGKLNREKPPSPAAGGEDAS
jgi:putative transcriptional regulator